MTSEFYFSDFKDSNDANSLTWFYNTDGSMNIDSSEEAIFATDEEAYSKMDELMSKTQKLDLKWFSDYVPSK